MDIKGLWNKHIGNGSSDYARARTLLDDVASGGSRKLTVGAGAGAALGAAAGYAVGLNNLIQDKVSVVEKTYEVQRPVLLGADYDHSYTEMQPMYDGDGNLTGYNTIIHPEDWSPIEGRQGTGKTFTRQEFEHTRGWGPMASAAVGLGAGAVVGGLAGLAAGLITRDQEIELAPSGRGNKAPMIGAAVGGVTGATLGAVAGHIAQSRAQSITQTVSEPIFENRVIGYIPYDSDYNSIPRELFDSGDRLYYDRLPAGGVPFEGREQVVRQVPTGEFRSRTYTESSQSLTPLTGALLGAGIGAAGGFAAGVAIGVLQKTLES